MKISKLEAIDRLRYTCSLREKCLYDIRKKLLEWNLSEEFDSISQLLLDDNYIDESRYVLSFVNDKIKFSKWGKIKIKYNLRMKGIDEQIINRHISEFPRKEYIEIIRKELLKKLKSIKEPDKYKRINKIMAFASQRGYESETARAFTDKL